MRTPIIALYFEGYDAKGLQVRVSMPTENMP